MKTIAKYLIGALILLLVVGFIWISHINDFKRDGQFEIAINEAPIKIHRDEYGIAYVVAQNKADAIRGQGFVAAQDRLFQIQFYRALINGELASIVGESMLQSDIKMRVMNLNENSQRNYAYLNDESKAFLQWYCEGFNAYLRVAKDEFPVELKLLNMEAQKLNPVDIMSLIHFIGLNHGQNMNDEILSLNLAARTKDAQALRPLNINPDRTKPLKLGIDTMLLSFSAWHSEGMKEPVSTLLPAPKFGSNNWAIAPDKSTSGHTLVCNDPHLDGRLLPGMFYPIGISCPSFKSVGLAIPGVPGLLVGRNEFVAFGVTNGYGDSQDLFIETADQDAYVQNGQKIPFEKRQECIHVKNGEDVNIEIRSTLRGPIISDFDVFGISTDDVVSLRWSLAQSTSPSIGIERFLEAKDVFQFREALMAIDNMFFNYVIGDSQGNIAHQATGLIPQRKNHQGEVPQKVSEEDSWIAFIPKDEMPHMINPQRQWVGTANNDTRPDDYPYYYSSHFSPNYRYLRMNEMMTEKEKLGTDDCWQMILDCKNTQAAQLNPIFVAALQQHENTQDIAAILNDWDYRDDIDEVGATIYHVLYDELVSLILDDELPEDMQPSFWSNAYYWGQRMDSFILAEHPFIDNKETEKLESLDELVVEAGLRAKALLAEKLGPKQEDWTWGNIHTLRFANPIRRYGLGSSLLGAETMPKKGSNETINRGLYKKQEETSYETSAFSVFRMVVDFSDKEKIRGALAGGSSARLLHPYFKSQVQTWKDENWIPYWLAPDKIEAHSQHLLILD